MAVRKEIDKLPGWAKALLGVLGVVDVGLRVLAVLDVANRPEEEVNGPKQVWLPALATVSSMGLLPAAYFTLGRRRA